MAGTTVLSKVLDIRESEKRDAQLAYKISVDNFEEVATKLLKLLQKKEAAEASYEEAISLSMSIDEIQERLAYIDTLQKKIDDLQGTVQQARSVMEIKQQQLAEAHVETKKFEKIIEIRKNEALTKEKKAEESFMDEISIQQYLSHR